MLVLGGIVLLLGCLSDLCIGTSGKILIRCERNEINRRSLSCYSLH